MRQITNDIVEYTYKEILDMFQVITIDMCAFEYAMETISKYWKVRYYDNRLHLYFVTNNFLTSPDLAMQLRYCISHNASEDKIYLYTIPEQHVITANLKRDIAIKAYNALDKII